jgi:hypothetical protein
MKMMSGHQPEAGILYVAFGYEYLLMAIHSVRTAKQSNPGIGAALVTNVQVSRLPAVSDLFDYIVEEDMRNELNRLAKTQAYQYSPFEKCLFLDCDTEVLGDVTPLFKCLDQYDVVLKMDPRPTRKIYEIAEGVPGHLFPTWNSGVVFFRKGNGADRFFAEWHRVFREMGGRSDQPALARTIYLNPDIKLLSVTAMWNTFPQDEELLRAKKIRFKSRIRHYRHPDQFPDVAAAIYGCHMDIGHMLESNLAEVKGVGKRYRVMMRFWYQNKISYAIYRRVHKRLNKILPMLNLELRRDKQRVGDTYKTLADNPE